MHHVPLDRPGPHDRHLDHQVVKLPRLQPRQHRHLGPALDLKHADRVGPADHVVHGLVFRRDRGERQLAAVVLSHQIEAFANRREHAQAQAIDLEDAQLVEIVLVPLDDRAVRHRGVFDRHQFAQRPLRHHHAADVLRQMPREADELVHAVDEPPAELATSGSMPTSRQRSTSFGSCV